MVVTRGDTYNFKIKYLDKDKNPIKIPDSGIIKFTVRDRIDGIQLFQKEMTLADYDETGGFYNLKIEAEDTSSVKLQGRDRVDYYYDFQLSYTANENEVIRTLDKGKFTIKYDITTN